MFALGGWMICGGRPSKNLLAHKFSGVKDIKDGLTKHKFFPYTEIMRILTTAPQGYLRQTNGHFWNGFWFKNPCFFFRCLSVPPKSSGPEGFMHRMVQRLLDGETTVLQLFASPLGWLNHMLATHRAPKTWNFPVKKLGEDLLKVSSSCSVFQRREFFGMHDFWNKTWFFKKCRIFFENRGKIEEPFPGTTSTSEGQSLRSGGF